LLIGLTLPLLGCRSAAPLPAVDLEDPGWTVWTGQARWDTGRGPVLAGDLLVARNEEGNVLVHFAKPPIPIFTAQTDGGRWHLDMVSRERSYGGRGRPPRRFVWFHLPRVLGGAPAPDPWRAERRSELEWHLENPRSGESIDLFLDR
jgi:hypothetical protein